VVDFHISLTGKICDEAWLPSAQNSGYGMNHNSAHNNKRIIQAWSDAARSDDVEKFLDEFMTLPVNG
jgi:hypothetical protein